MIKNLSGDELPPCFGKQYDSKAPECEGGHDPAYQGSNGSHVRPACDHRGSCSARTQAIKNANGLVPISALARPPTAFNRPSTPFTPPTAPIQPYRAQNYPQQYTNQHVGVQQMMPVNYSVPQYLSVREVADGRTMAVRLILEVVRSIGKALGHTIAHFFDTEAFGKKNNGNPPQES